jgi:hypothetical protein
MGPVTEIARVGRNSSSAPAIDAHPTTFFNAFIRSSDLPGGAVAAIDSFPAHWVSQAFVLLTDKNPDFFNEFQETENRARVVPPTMRMR